ncbi:transglycosylase SLT domain-containing protein [Oligoflexaceae bacterium]|nr:transglycosylase SLT domain-containing protein [Oligoflexaceae bacterium]
MRHQQQNDQPSSFVTIASFLCFAFLGSLWGSPSLSSQGAESPEAVTRRMIKKMKRQRFQTKEIEAQRLKKIENPTPSISIMAFLKRAKFYSETNPKLAMQILKIAESSLTIENEKFFTTIRIGQAEIYKRNASYEDVIRLLRDKRIQWKGETEVPVRKLMSFAYSNIGNHKKAIYHFRKVINDISLRGLPDDFAMAMAKSFDELDKEPYRQKMLEVVAARYPFSPLSSVALEKLVAASSIPKNQYYFSSSLLRRLKLHASLSEKLEDELPRFLDLPFVLGNKKIFRATLLERAELAMNLNLDDAAQTALESAKEQLHTRKEKSKYLLLSSRHCIRGGDFDCALEYLNDHKSKFTHLSRAARVNVRIARILAEKGDYKESSVAFEKYAKRTNRRQDRWNHFWSLYRSENYEESLKALRKRGYVKGHDSYRTSEEKMYWQGKVLEKMGRLQGAAESYGDLIYKYPESFYTVLLRSRFGNIVSSSANQNQVSKNSTLLKIMQRMAQNAKAMFASTGIIDPNTLDKPEEKSAAELNDELQVRIVANLKIKSRSSTTDSKNTEGKFPKAYESIVLPHAESIDVDPYLTYSLMKAESGFKKDAVSWVGAKGLMQIMPYTGIRIANALSDPLFEVTALSDPLVNVSYAQYYIKRLVDHFDGNIIHAIAAYNGGPDAVDRWISRCKGCEIDDFVESIGYRETRKYVKKVLRYYSNYKFLYEDARPLPAWPQVPYNNDSKRPIF